MAVPNIFGTATSAIPLSQLDQNFATAITLGNTAVYLGNTTTSLGNVTLTNVTISSGTSNIAANVSTAVGLLPEANGGTGTTTGYYGFKNRIINGAMVIDQRNAGASVNLTSGGVFVTDRFYGYEDSDGTMTGQQVLKSASSGNAPTGFSSSLLFTTGTADASLAAAQYSVFGQSIEGLNVSDLDWGTANASTITLSFYVKSSLTGTFSGSLRNSTPNRAYVFTYTINSANTWEQKTITIAGDTSGTWLTTNGVGIGVLFGLGVGSTYSSSTTNAWQAGNFFSATGSTSVIGTASATFYITGVQLEKGSTATSFDYRPIGTELNLCLRYFWKSNAENAGKAGCINGSFNSTTTWSGFIQFPVPMRAQPTITRGGTNDNFYAPNVSGALTGNVVGFTYSTISAFTEFNSASPAAASVGYYASYNGQVSVNAEL
jgi:hypothetical protein